MESRGSAIVTAAVAIVLLVLGAGFLVFRVYTPPSSASPPITPEVRQFAIDMHAAAVGEETMHHWLPATVVVNVGDTVILKVTNSDPEATHGFALAAFNTELRTRESELVDALFHLRLRRATSQLPNPMKVRETKRDLARVKTVLRARAAAGEGTRA